MASEGSVIRTPLVNRPAMAARERRTSGPARVIDLNYRGDAGALASGAGPETVGRRPAAEAPRNTGASERGQQLLLDPIHLRLEALLPLRVLVPEQVQDPVDDQPKELFRDRRPLALRPFSGGVGADVDVA